MVKKAPDKDWGKPRKVAARQATVVDIYRWWSGLNTLPPNLFYWTICGWCGREGQLLEMCEFDHVVKREKLIEERQWVGVDRDKEVFAGNSTLSIDGKWFNEDIVACYARLGKDFPAGLMNLDLTNFVRIGFRVVGDMLCLIGTKNPCLVIANVVRSHKLYKPVTPLAEVLGEAATERCLGTALRSGWTYADHLYSYAGTDGRGRSQSVMNTILFVNRPPRIHRCEDGPDLSGSS